MDELIGILINVLVDLFRGKTPTPPANQAPPARPGSRPPLKQMPPRRPVAQRPARQVARKPVAATQKIDRLPLSTSAPSPQEEVRSIVSAAPPPPSVAHRSVVVDAAALRRWLKPQVLRNQFILSEIFQKPLALRESSPLWGSSLGG